MAVTSGRDELLGSRRSTILLTAVFSFIAFLIYISPRKPSPTPLLESVTSPPANETPSIPYNFGQDHARDYEAFDGLSDEQCTSAFPDLYTDIDRAVEYWKAKAYTISANDVDISETRTGIRILIHQNELRILESVNAMQSDTSPERAEGTLHLLYRALQASIAAGEVLPTIEVGLSFRDEAELPDAHAEFATHSVWGFSHHVDKEWQRRVWLMPNFDFWFSPPTGSFSDAKRGAMQHDKPFAEKIPKIVWRGNPDFNHIRESLIDVTRGKDWADVMSIHELKDGIWMRIDEFCKYAITVYTEGFTYSGRLKFLMNCHSLLFVHEEVEYRTHYSHLLVTDGPQQNCVTIKKDWSDLEEKVKWYLDHPEESERIITNSLMTFRSRYTTRAATSCYIRRLIRGFSEVAWTPETHVPMNDWDEEGMRLRGRSYEKFFHESEDGNFERD